MADVSVVVFPGSNCDRDAYHALGSVFKKTVNFHWYTDPIDPNCKLVILPGGFSYGDYLRCGAIAKISPVVESLGEYIDKGGLVLGICNGFQILVEAGYLPGALHKNRSLSFQCEDVHVAVESTTSPFLDRLPKGQVLRLPIAHSEGRYVADEQTLKELESERRIALRYSGPKGEQEDRFNANGSVQSIAAVTNKKGNVLGLMPHPERCSEEILGNTDGRRFFESLVSHL